MRPRGYDPAVNYKGEIFAAGEHADAMAAARAKHGQAFDDWMEAHPDDGLGWVRKAEAADPAARAEAEQAAELARLKSLIDSGEATPEDIRAHNVLDRIMLQRAMRDWDLRAKSMEHPADFTEVLDPFAYDPGLSRFKSLGEALAYIRDNTEDFGTGLAGLIGRIFEDVKDIPLHVVDQEAMDAALAAGADDGLITRNALGTFDPVQNVARVRGWMGHVPGTEGMLEAPSGTNPVVITHEAIHAATNRRIEQGLLDRRLGRDTPYAAMAGELEGLRDDFLALVERDRDRLVAGMDLAGRQDLDVRLGLVKDDVHEFLTYATTQPYLREFLEATPARQPRGWIKTAWDEIVDLYLRLIGKEAPTRADQLQMGQLFDILSRYTEMEQPLMRGELAPGVKAMAAPGEETFITVGDAMDQRIKRLTPRQRSIFEERAGSLLEADGHLARAKQDLQTVTESPHEFLDGAGRPEPYYHRIWNKTKIAGEQAKLTRLIERWYARDNPDGAGERAAETVDNILSGDVQLGTEGNMSALGQRTSTSPTRGRSRIRSSARSASPTTSTSASRRSPSTTSGGRASRSRWPRPTATASCAPRRCACATT